MSSNRQFVQICETTQLLLDEEHRFLQQQEWSALPALQVTKSALLKEMTLAGLELQGQGQNSPLSDAADLQIWRQTLQSSLKRNQALAEALRQETLHQSQALHQNARASLAYLHTLKA